MGHAVLKYMNRILILILMMACSMFSLAYAEIETKYIKTSEYEGVIFPSEYNLTYINGDLAQAVRWGPDEENISEAEKLSAQYAQTEGVCPGKVLKNYKRQYFGFINQKNEKIVWINYFISSAEFGYWKKDVVFVNDGGCNFFNVEVNLTTKNIFNFSVNGAG